MYANKANWESVSVNSVFELPYTSNSTGRGIWNVRHLVEKNSGAFEVTSVYGRGKTVPIYLPQILCSQVELTDISKSE